MALSVFDDKATVPSAGDLHRVLNEKAPVWGDIVSYCLGKWPKLNGEWYYSGKSFGWNYRVKDSKRAVVYLIPVPKGFLVAMVFGQKAFEKVMESTVCEPIKQQLAGAKPYVEGRGIRFAVEGPIALSDVFALIDIKQSK